MPILVCDEATSAPDGATERQIIDTLRSISHDRTTIVIAHRLSTAQHADLIIVLNEGKAKQVGSPKELLVKEGQSFQMGKSSSSRTERRFMLPRRIRSMTKREKTINIKALQCYKVYIYITYE